MICSAEAVPVGAPNAWTRQPRKPWAEGRVGTWVAVQFRALRDFLLGKLMAEQRAGRTVEPAWADALGESSCPHKWMGCESPSHT